MFSIESIVHRKRHDSICINFNSDLWSHTKHKMNDMRVWSCLNVVIWKSKQASNDIYILRYTSCHRFLVFLLPFFRGIYRQVWRRAAFIIKIVVNFLMSLFSMPFKCHLGTFFWSSCFSCLFVLQYQDVLRGKSFRYIPCTTTILWKLWNINGIMNILSSTNRSVSVCCSCLGSKSFKSF